MGFVVSCALLTVDFNATTAQESIVRTLASLLNRLIDIVVCRLLCTDDWRFYKARDTQNDSDVCDEGIVSF